MNATKRPAGTNTQKGDGRAGLSFLTSTILKPCSTPSFFALLPNLTLETSRSSPKAASVTPPARRRSRPLAPCFA